MNFLLIGKEDEYDGMDRVEDNDDYAPYGRPEKRQADSSTAIPTRTTRSASHDTESDTSVTGQSECPSLGVCCMRGCAMARQTCGVCSDITIVLQQVWH